MTTHQHLFPGIQPADFARMQEAFEQSELTCNYIDVCSPDYLTDHHNRDNEFLLCGTPSFSKIALRQSLLESTDCCNHIPKEISLDAIDKAIEDMVDGLFLWQQLPEIDGVLVDEDNLPEDIYVYAYLAW